MKKLLLLLVFFIALISCVNAFSINSINLVISVDEKGMVFVQEKYFLSFNDLNELNEFKAKVNELGPNFTKWSNLDERIKPHFFAPGDNFIQKSISFEEKDLIKVFSLNYKLTSSAFALTETAFLKRYSLLSNRLNEFISAATLTIPENVSIEFILPKRVIINYPISPEAKIKENSIIWQGFLNTNQVNLSFEIPKPLTPRISIALILFNLSSYSATLIFVFVLFLLIVLFLKRKTIVEKVNSFFLNNSEFLSEED